MMLNLILGKDIAFYVKRHRRLVACALLLMAISSLFVVVPVYLIKPFVDEGMNAGADLIDWKIPWIAFDKGSFLSWHRSELLLVRDISPDNLLILLMIVAALSVFIKSITLYFGGLFSVAFANRTVTEVRQDLFQKFVSLPLGFYHNKKLGELVARSTADLTVMQNLIANVLTGLVQHPLTALVFLCYLLLVNYKLTLLVFFMGPLIVGLVRLFGRKVKKHAARIQDATAEVTSVYQEDLLCLKVIQGFFTGKEETNKFRELADNLYKRVMRWNRWDLGVSPLMDSTVFLILPTIFILGKVYFHHTLGELISMAYAFSQVYVPVKKLARVNNKLKTLQGATKRVFAIMQITSDIKESPEAKDLPRHREVIEFRNVNFGYSPHNLILKDISFRVEAGLMVAFVGSTGAGKSTLLDLIPRFYDVTGGSINIDGADIRDVTIKSLRRQIGIVNQNTLLFHDNIANNICYGRPDMPMEKIVAAARTAYADKFIRTQPNGYQTIVGDQGTRLSGGQRQRIAIARALLIDPAVLILDEAASALDAESEKLVQAAIEKIRGHRTILIVSHRLSTVMRADRIFVMEKGRIVEAGNFKSLLALNGRFRQLYDMQFSD